MMLSTLSFALLVALAASESVATTSANVEPSSASFFRCSGRASREACLLGNCDCVWCNDRCEEAPTPSTRPGMVKLDELLEGRYRDYCSFDTTSCRRRACRDRDWPMVRLVLVTLIGSIVSLALFAFASVFLFSGRRFLPFVSPGMALLTSGCAFFYFLISGLTNDPYAHCG